KRWYRRPLVWVITGVGAVVVIFGVGALLVFQSAQEARRGLTEVTPTVSALASQMIAGDTDAARASAAELTAATAAARAETSGWLWRTYEHVPLLGPNLTAVRTVAEVVDELASDVATPAAEVSISSLMPKDGGFDLPSLAAFAEFASAADGDVASALQRLEAIDTGALLPEVTSGVTQIRDKLN